MTCRNLLSALCYCFVNVCLVSDEVVTVHGNRSSGVDGCIVDETVGTVKDGLTFIA